MQTPSFCDVTKTFVFQPRLPQSNVSSLCLNFSAGGGGEFDILQITNFGFKSLTVFENLGSLEGYHDISLYEGPYYRKAICLTMTSKITIVAIEI